MLEDKLRTRIQATLSHLKADQANGLFQERGTLYDFSSKINVARAMNLIGSKTKNDLDIIRDVRNAFAHGAGHVSFDDGEIQSICFALEFRHHRLSKDNPSDAAIIAMMIANPNARNEFLHSIVAVQFILENREIV